MAKKPTVRFMTDWKT